MRAQQRRKDDELVQERRKLIEVESDHGCCVDQSGYCGMTSEKECTPPLLIFFRNELCGPPRCDIEDIKLRPCCSQLNGWVSKYDLVLVPNYILLNDSCPLYIRRTCSLMVKERWFVNAIGLCNATFCLICICTCAANFMKASGKKINSCVRMSTTA